MKSINLFAIQEYLEQNGFEYKIENTGKTSYTLASLFNPVQNGFYFFVGDEIPSNISNSLFLVSTDFNWEINNQGNAFIRIKADPQRVYYQIISHYFSAKSTGQISNLSIIDEDAVIGKNVQIDPFCIIGKVIIKDNVVIKSHSYLHDNTEVEEATTIDSHSVIGAKGLAWIWNEDQSEKIIQPQLGGVKIGRNVFLAANTIIVRGSINEYTEIGKSTLLAPGCRIGHGTKIGNYVHFANNVITGGNTHVGDYSFVGSAAVFRPKVKVHPHTIVGAGALVIKNTTSEGKTLMGVPAVESISKDNPSGMPKPKLK
jgi:UDP-3-O-[3-hydroxymyristoyl] glucosamine N-acyltransferase